MSRTITNPRVRALVREAAARSGLSQTSVIEIALEQYLASLDNGEEAARRERLYRLLDEAQRTTTPADRAALQHDVENLYDDQGLPR